VYASRDIGGGEIFLKLIRYYETQMKRFNVDVRLNTDVNAKVCAEIAPDVGVVAAGSEIDGFSIPGMDRKNVVLAYSVLEEGSPCGDRVVVLGGERIGLVAAEYLATRNKDVTIVETGKRLGEDVIATFKCRHAAWVKQLEIKTLLKTTPVAIEDDGVLVEEEGTRRMLPADTVIVSIQRKSRQQLISDLESVCDELYAVGDAIKPRSMHNAIRDGYLIGIRI